MNLNHKKLSLTKLILVLFIFSNSVFSQEKFSKHKVQKGESFHSISKKYKVSIDDLYKWNPDAKANLKPDLELIVSNSQKIVILKNSNKKDKKLEEIGHEVQSKETLYGIARKYEISIESIKKSNPSIDFNALKLGTKLILLVPGYKNEATKAIVFNDLETINHTVQPKETKYSIAKKYGKTIQELETLNPEIKSGLPSGYELVIQVASSNGNTIESNQQVQVVEISNEKEPIPVAETQVVTNENEPPKEKVLLLGSLLLDGLVEKASEFIGVRYRSGGTNKDGFDCSGLMTTTFDTFDIKLPRTSAGQSEFGTTISTSDAKKGDLIFFAINGGSRISHVGMITDVVDGEIKFIHSSVSNGVMISSNSESYYASRFVKVNRVIQ